MTTTAATAEPRVLTPKQLASRQKSALKRALDGRLWERVEGYAEGEYGVPASDGKGQYYVSLVDPDEDGKPSCTCLAGFHHIPCKHVAAVILLAGLPSSWRDALR